jgi:hypothetical protein
MDRTQHHRIVTIRGSAGSSQKPAGPIPVKQPPTSQRIVIIRQGHFVGDKAVR